MKLILRVFSLGILTATIIFGSIYYIEADAPNQTVIQELSTEEMITKLENQGYFITDEQENSSEASKESLNTDNTQEEINEKETEEVKPRTYTLTIKSGMTISEISEYLIAANIIENRDTFASYLIENNYGTSIQIGQYELHTDMSTEEIAKIITKQN